MCEGQTDRPYHRMQHFVSESPWLTRKVMQKVASDASELLDINEKTGLIIDESSHVKRGDKSVGVARQYCGRLGKVENCQVGVYAFLSAGSRATLVDFRLYLPQSWIKDKKRCDQAGIPPDKQVFKTKPQQALEMIRAQREAGVRFDWVGEMDCTATPRSCYRHWTRRENYL